VGGDLHRPVLLLHVLSAFLYAAGYIGTNLLTEVARRTDDPTARRYALRFSSVTDRLYEIGGTLVALTGVLAFFVFGYSPFATWLLGATGLYLVIVVTSIVFWARVGREVDRAIQAGDDERAVALLRSQTNIVVSRTENVLFVLLIALMVLRPGS